MGVSELLSRRLEINSRFLQSFLRGQILETIFVLAIQNPRTPIDDSGNGHAGLPFGVRQR